MRDRSFYHQQLATSGWFAARTAAFQKDLLDCAVPKAFSEGEMLYHHGDPASGIYAILKGAVQITAPADDGQEFVLHREGTGFWIGDLALFAGTSRLVSVGATQDTETLFFPNTRISRLAKNNPEYVFEFYALTHENMHTALRIMANMAVTGTEKRLVLRLLHLDESMSETDGWIVVSQEDLAQMIAVSQPTLHRSLHRLSDLGLIEIGYGRVKLTDRRALIASCQS